MKKKLLTKILTATIVLSVPLGYQRVMAAPLPISVPQGQKVIENREATNEYYRQQELLQNVPEDKQEKVIVEKEKTVPLMDQNQTVFTVKKIEFNASEFLSAEELSVIAQKYEGNDLSFQDLNRMLEEVNALYYSKKVITAKAVLLPQKIIDGLVHVTLIEGRYGDFKIIGNQRSKEEYILNGIHLKKMQLVRLEELEKNLTYFNKTNIVSLKAELAAGKEVGVTDCILHVQEPSPWDTTLYADNAGSHDSGLYRIGALIVGSNLNGWGDSLVINPTWTEGTLAGSISYSQPIDTYGTKLGFSYGKNTMDIINGSLSSMDVKGDSEDFGINLLKPVKVTNGIKTEAFIDVHHKLSETDFFGENLLHTVLNTYTAGYNIQQNLKGGLWYTSVSGTQIHGSQKNNYTDKNFSRGNITVIRQQAFANKQIFTLRTSMQYSKSKELPSSEQFSLGGISTVKGFAESVISGENGHYWGLEYSMPVNNTVNSRVFFGFDHGAVKQSFTDGSSQKDYLTSASIGYSQDMGKNAFAKIILGIPLAHSESVSHDKTRVHFYLQRKL